VSATPLCWNSPKQSASVVIDYVSHPEATSALEKQIARLGERALLVDADVSKVADLQKLIEVTVANLGAATSW